MKNIAPAELAGWLADPDRPKPVLLDVLGDVRTWNAGARQVTGVDEAAILGPDFDLEVVEMHHRLKKDAPSGTALELADRLASAGPPEVAVPIGQTQGEPEARGADLEGPSRLDNGSECMHGGSPPLSAGGARGPAAGGAGRALSPRS